MHVLARDDDDPSSTKCDLQRNDIETIEILISVCLMSKPLNCIYTIAISLIVILNPVGSKTFSDPLIGSFVL